MAQVVVIGGSGMLGRLTVPRLAVGHDVCVLDPAPPPYCGTGYVAGVASDYPLVREVIDGCDAVVYMAMGRNFNWNSPHTAATHFDAGPKGLYLVLRAAADASVRTVVYTSTQLVFRELLGSDHDRPSDATDMYGLTKRLGEEVCRAAADSLGLSVIALRLCGPVADRSWLGNHHERLAHLMSAADDIAEALATAIRLSDVGFLALPVSAALRAG